MDTMAVRDKIILALDVSEAGYALDIVDRFQGYVNLFKVGLELFTSTGPMVIKEIQTKGRKVFLDLKLHDIPNTVSKAAIAAARLGVHMLSIHAGGGLEMMQRCIESVIELSLRENIQRPKILGVTVLTGLSQEVLRNELGIQHSLKTHVKVLSNLAKEAGLDGIVASGHEVGMLRNHFGKGFLIVVPGIRASWTPPDDQKRTMTPREAIIEGADYLVLGRAILNQPNPFRALELIETEILTA
jgi:orotidine-5'-phosphate decarboxylase